MDIDKQMREAVRSGSQESIEDVRFTKEMELRIRGEIAQNKHKNRNRLFMAGSLAACFAVTAVGMHQQGWFPQMPSGKNLASAVSTTATDKKNTEAKQNSVKVSPEEAILPLKKAITAISKTTIRVDSTSHGISDITLLEGNNARASVAYDIQTGQIESFIINGERPDPYPENWDETSVKMPSAKTAESVANAFLQSFLGEESKSYQYLGTDTYLNEFWEESIWLSVSYQRMENGKPVPYDILSVRINSKEQVSFFGRLNKSEQAFFTKLTAAMPDLNPSLLLFDKEKNRDGMSLAVGNVNKEGHQASLRIVGNGQALESYSIEEKDKKDESSWKQAKGAKAVEQERQFLNNLLGADSENYRLEDESKPGVYQRYHNGLPVLSDEIHMTTDESGLLRFFRKEPETFDPSQYPDVSTAVSEEVAIQELSEHMKLRYVQNLDARSDERVEKGRPVLEYTPGVSFMQKGREDGMEWHIDATSGKIAYGTGDNGLAFDQLDTKEAHAFQSPKEYVKVRSKEEAKALLQAEFGIQVDDSTYGENKIDRNGRKEYVWNDKNDKYIGVEVIGETGSVVGLGTPRSNTAVTVNRKQAEEAALAFLHKYVDPGVTEVQLAQVIQPGGANPVSSGEWEFRYFMSKDGIPVLDDDNPDAAYSVTIDPSTGKVTKFHNFRETHDLVELPVSDNIVSKDKAVQEFLRVMPLKLVYLMKDVDRKTLRQPKLAYVPWSNEELANKTVTIDAVTGKIIVD
ncbi:YcdB/YcdC domain-containing protein [Brevibacillus sp. FIR094]|uniref:YcdB/YcdC domain-containing protein n=1 Tax=Brevibacillus sp. FIR094 TaxID=3134809 RepID=UPI003D21DFC7